MPPFVEPMRKRLVLVHRGPRSGYVEWEFSLPFDFAEWIYDHCVVAVRKHVDPISEIPSTVFLTDEAIVVQNGQGKVVFLGEDHQRYVLDGFRMDGHIGELIWDFESDSASCLRLSDGVKTRVTEIRKRFPDV